MRTIFMALGLGAVSIVALIGVSQAIFSTGFISSFVLSSQETLPQSLSFNAPPTVERLEGFAADNLKTNTAISIIPLSKILGGGPGKDDIPALTNPSYISAEAAKNLYDDNSSGVLVEINGDARWLSFDILYWHEIVNDNIGGLPVAVTFCPLCGSAITFNRQLEAGTELEFGVSGKLWQSNLLMYDQGTESLWSQIEGEAKVGDLTGTQLEVVHSNVISWEEVKTIPNLKVLSQDTGYRREYGQNPYGTYEQNSELMFPMDTEDNRLAPKTIMIAGQFEGLPFAIERLPLLNRESLTIKVNQQPLQVSTVAGKIEVRAANGTLVPTFNTMWFSWANHYKTPESVIWTNDNKNTDSSDTAEQEPEQLTLYEYFSYGCSYCDQIHDALDEALTEFPTVELQLKHFIVYEQFMPIHEAQVCAAEQNKGYEFHDRYFRNYYPQKEALTGFQIAEDLGLDLNTFTACKASERPQEVINKDMQAGVALGVRGTPTLLIDGPNTSLQAFNERSQTGITKALQTFLAN